MPWIAEVDPDRKKSSGPELAGALESNPDIYVPDKLEVEVDTSDFVLPEPEWRLSKMAMSSTHEVGVRGREHPTLRRRALLERSDVAVSPATPVTLLWSMPNSSAANRPAACA